MFSKEVATRPSFIEVAPWYLSERLRGERDTLGLYLTGHPLDPYRDDLHALTTHRISDLASAASKKATLAGLVTGVRKMLTKTQKRMAVMTLDDTSARTEVTVFSELFEKSKELLTKDSLLLVKGEITTDDYTGGYRCQAEELMPLYQARQALAKSLTIQLQAPADPGDRIQAIKDCLARYQGGHTKTRICYQEGSTQVLLPLGEQWQVVLADQLLEELSALLDAQRFAIEY